MSSARGAWPRCLLVWLLPGVEGIGVKAGIEVRNGLEYHAGHAADHTTALTHRLRASSAWCGAAGGCARQHEAELSAHHAFRGLCRPSVRRILEDMSSEYTGIIGVGTAQDGGAQFEARRACSKLI